MADQSNIQSAASKSIRPFKSSEEYLYAMKEDLAEWLNTLYELELSVDTFMEGLETGCALCRHANHVNRAARDFQLEYPEAARSLKLPSKDVVFQSRNVIPGSFLARDNVSNFISWCRQELWVKDVLMFETNDLVERCNEKNFVLCLLEVARRGAKFGMLAPMLIQLEEEIEEEIRDQGCVSMEAEEESPQTKRVSREKSHRGPVDEQEQEPIVWPQKRVLCDMRNLDELVREILGRCNCPAQFPMIKVSEGKYKVGDSSALIFIRVLRTHVMVRVGGGWDTLEHYLDKHDPCRCAAFAHRYHQAKASGQGQGSHSKSSSAQSSRSTSPGPHWKNEPVSTCKPSSSPSCTGSSPSRSSEVDGPTQNLQPRPPRDCSEPRHLNRLRNKETVLPLTRRLSGDSNSSTASSKGSVGPYTRRSGEEVILMVNRKEGRHMIERPGATNPVRTLRQSPRARSQSREHTLKPSPSTTTANTTEVRPERGRSLGTDSPRRFHGPRSHSQGKLTGRTQASDASPGPASRLKDPQKEDPRTKPITPAFSRTTKRQPVATNSVAKPSSSNTPSKKTVTGPRPPVPWSPTLGKTHVFPPVSTSRSSPHSSPNRHHHVTRPHRSTHGHGGLNQNASAEEPSRRLGFHMLPPLDPQKEQDLYRSFEAEFLENTRHVMDGARAHLKPSSDVTDSAYSSSNSSSSSLNVGTKAGSLPDLKETKRAQRQFPVDDPLNLLYGSVVGTGGLAPREAEHWVGRGLRKLPAISSPVETEQTSDMFSHRSDCSVNQGSFQSQCRNLNGGCASAEGRAGDQTQPGDVACVSHSADLPLGVSGSEDLPLPSEDQDSSSESSSMCLSLSESHSESPPPPPHCLVLLNGLTDSSRKDIHKHKLRARVRPRADPRPAHSPSRIPTPVSYRSPSHTPVSYRSPCHTPVSYRSPCHTPVSYRSPCHTPVSYRSPCHTPVSYRSPCHTPVSYRSPCHTPVSYRSPSHTPPLSPSCKNLHQAFTGMNHSQQHSPSMGTNDCQFAGQSESLDTEAWM